MKHNPKRPGYAMLLVLAFVLLMTLSLALAYGQLATLLRTETARAQQIQRDEGSTVAAANGLALLETGFPPSSPYACDVTINTSTGATSFTVTFTSQGANVWTVNSAPSTPGDGNPPMPSTFAGS
ncbi:MAG TPA: hypothetical protein VGX76_06085 [Pirellulales bacterium]|jgi:hypothetical protein|nr:hypothetical protein [Pirellulales bacterium]